jgi:hypothetical protein
LEKLPVAGLRIPIAFSAGMILISFLGMEILESYCGMLPLTNN